MAETKSSRSMTSLLISRSPLFNGKHKNSARVKTTTLQEMQDLVINPVQDKALVPVQKMENALPLNTNVVNNKTAVSKAKEVLLLLTQNFSAILNENLPSIPSPRPK